MFTQYVTQIRLKATKNEINDLSRKLLQTL